MEKIELSEQEVQDLLDCIECWHGSFREAVDEDIENESVRLDALEDRLNKLRP